MNTVQIIQAGVTLVVLIMVFCLLWTNRMPSIQGVIDCANVLNSKGGNLLLLALMSGWFFYESLRFAYHLINLMIDGKLTTDNAIALSMFSFVTGTAFGGAFGALLKGMSGEPVVSTGASTVKTDTTTTKTVSTPATAPPVNVEADLPTPPISPIEEPPK